ncbi:MAG: hypothetical protein H0V84_00385 [Actinobacteria bacterium]|nr:hypothetical protein [Actinomycetota bacterium]
MEILPDLPTLSTDALRKLLRELEQREDEISYQRRILHGQIGILRSEFVARLQKGGERSLEVDVEKLSEILSSKGPLPPAP